MARYLLDTNILSELVRYPQGRVAECIAQMGEKAVCTSLIVASELRFAAAKKMLPRSPHRLKPSRQRWTTTHSSLLLTGNTPSCAFILKGPARLSGQTTC